jgi:hypothetical protein
MRIRIRLPWFRQQEDQVYLSLKGQPTMSVTVGNTGTFLATPEPAGSIVPAGVVPVWTSSDVTVATVASPNPDATGLTTILTGVLGGTITLTVTATLADGTIAQGSAVVTINPGEVKSFTITQTA